MSYPSVGGSSYQSQRYGLGRGTHRGSKRKTEYKLVEPKGRWVTFNGIYVLVKSGETVIEAYERTTGKTFKPYIDELDVREGKVDPSVFKKEQVTKEAAKKILSELPPEQTEGITVEVRSDFGLANVEGFTGAKVLADYGSDEFNPKKGTLTVSTDVHDKGSARARLAIFHEVGHHIYRTILSSEDKADWNHFWTEHKVELPSDYALTKPTEGFAEAYANWQESPGSMGPYVNRWFSKRLKWKG